MTVYVVDTNFFIQAHRSYYPLDVVPTFWRRVRDLAEEGKIVSIDKVKDEIYGNKDALRDWCKSNLPHNFFCNSEDVIAEYGQVAAWATNQPHYTQSAKSKFLVSDTADAWLISFALALSTKRTIVTYEKSAPGIRHTIKIPEACNAFNISFLDPMTMLRTLGVTI